MNNPSELRSRIRWGVAGLLTLLAVFLAFKVAPDPRQGCPSGTTMEDTSREQICLTPTGKTQCTMTAFGISPYKGALLYGPAPEGPWCKGAHDWNQ